MTLWTLASRRIIPGTVQRSSTVAASAIGGTRQMSVADKDNILPVSFSLCERGPILYYMSFCCYSMELFICYELVLRLYMLTYHISLDIMMCLQLFLLYFIFSFPKITI